MIRWIFYWKKEGIRYDWYFQRRWIKWTGLKAVGIVKKR